MKRVTMAVLMCVVVVGLVASCADTPTGNGEIHGNVESFENTAVVARLLAAREGVTVYLDGPVSRRTTTDANGDFIFAGLVSGEYSISFSYNGELVTYRGASGQEESFIVQSWQVVQMTGIKVSGGHVNVGNFRVLEMDDNWNPIYPEDDGDGSGDDGGTDGVETNDTGSVETGGGATSAPPAAPDITSGLMAYYPMDGNANDASGNSNHGAVNGGVSWSASKVVGSGSCELDGASGYIDCGRHASINITGHLTLAAWVNNHDLSGYGSAGQLIIGKHNDMYNNPERQYALALSESVGVPIFAIGRLPNVDKVGTGPAVAINTWYHIAGVYDGASLTLYINGVATETKSTTTPMVSAAVNLFIGNRTLGDYGAKFYDGLVDDLRVYNRALTAEQIAHLYTIR